MKQLDQRKAWHQFFTPVWAAELLFNAHFNHLTSKDTVWEPTCGEGSFLSVIPKHIHAIGSDIDPNLVKAAAHNTGRIVHNGDFRSITFDKLEDVTAIVGNPPFDLSMFEEFMSRCANILPKGNKAGFIIPAYFFQTSKTFMRFARQWDIQQEILPRDLFNAGGGLLSKPIVWASFIREDFPKIIGFRLHAELCDVNNLKQDVKDIINSQIKRNGSVWREALIKVVRDSGGVVTLEQVYKNMQSKRPTENPFWKDQIRKVIQQTPFQRVGEATYQLIQ